MDIMQYGFRKCVLRNFELSQWLAKNMMLLPNNDNSSMSDTSCKQASVSPNAHSLGDELTKCLKKAKRPANNISKGEFKALQELKADTDITILPADKVWSTVILNTKDYESKLSTLLSNSNTYEKPQKDPTLKFKRTDQMIQRWHHGKRRTQSLRFLNILSIPE